MQRRKPLGWPPYMVPRPLKSGATGFFWVPPTWAKKKGCTLKCEALGTNYAEAKKRCDELLNPQFVAWRKGLLLPIKQLLALSIGWLQSTSHRRFIKSW
jgi:hypothetical protein